MKKSECNFCGHKWETKSRLKFVSCPSCLKKVKIKEGDTSDTRQ
jgi:DNA-directed RNA polymerase subunit RPC12/RpoP